MKALVLTLDDELFNRLNKLMTHKGERIHLLRKAVRRLVIELEEAKYGKVGTSKRPIDSEDNASGRSTGQG